MVITVGVAPETGESRGQLASVTLVLGGRVDGGEYRAVVGAFGLEGGDACFEFGQAGGPRSEESGSSPRT